MYIYILIGSLIGSRAFHVLYEAPRFYLENPVQILYLWNGGYVFFGGLIGGVTSLYLFTKKKSEDFLIWTNFTVPILSIGYAVGRFACFLSGCCYGKQFDGVWAVYMHEAYRHPAQIYAVLLELMVFLILFFLEKKKGFEELLVLPVWLVLHGISRAVVEVYRADDRGMFVFGLSVSTVISLILIFLGVWILTKRKKSN